MILLDTTPLVALCDGRDAHHVRAVVELGKLAGTGFATCEAVLVEACFHLPHAAQRQRLRALLDQLEVVLLPAGPDRQYPHQVFDWLVKYADHEPDWADAALAVLSSQHAAARVWTYDREFLTTWRRQDGTPIPLAVT